MKYLLALFLLTACFENSTPNDKPTTPERREAAPSPVDDPEPPPTTTTTTLPTASISLCWDPNPEPNIAGYKIYRDGNLARQVLHPETRGTVDGLEAGIVYGFHVTAYDTDGLESDPSEEVRYAIPRMAIVRGPQGLEVRFTLPSKPANVLYHLESKGDLNDPIWMPEEFTPDGEIGVHYVRPGEMRFYRVRLEVLAIGCAA